MRTEVVLPTQVAQGGIPRDTVIILRAGYGMEMPWREAGCDLFCGSMWASIEIYVGKRASQSAPRQSGVRMRVLAVAGSRDRRKCNDGK